MENYQNQSTSLHESFFETAHHYPDYEAIVWYEDEKRKKMSYSQLEDQILRMAGLLKQKGIQKGEGVAISMPKGPWQIISVMAVLTCGCIYIPIDINWAAERKTRICKISKVKKIITLSSVPMEYIDQTNIIFADNSINLKKIEKISSVDVHSSAYIIFTSGTTGEPKGVEISHHAALNTIMDVNERFDINSRDKCYAISDLNFDLSVYDIFGILIAGGTVIIPQQADRKAADKWLRLLLKEQVTLWNSVPAIYEMLLTIAEAEKAVLPLKKVLLSGDWVHSELYDRTMRITKDCIFVSLGGATEASIWSVYFVVNSSGCDAVTVPYGYPLSNQKVLVMDEKNAECLGGTVGELWIGGLGVAKGYINNPDMTKERFVLYKGDRWYRTGDLVKKTKAGYLEFLGRKDYQIKLNGYRIELKEIESNIIKSGKVDKTVVVFSQSNHRPKLIAAIKPHVSSIEGCNTRIEFYKGNSLNSSTRQKEVLVFIQKLLGFIKNNGLQITEEMKPLYKLWEKRCQREIKNINDVGTYDNYVPLYLDIFSGKVSANELLKYHQFNPESLVFESTDLKAFLDKIVHNINSSNKSNRIGIIQARTGKLVEILDKNTAGQEYILFDESSSMLAEAYDSDIIENKCQFSVVSNGMVDSQYLNSCDYVIAVNTLHQFQNKLDGLRLASMLLKHGGKLLIIECGKEDPIALITSYVLETSKRGGSLEYDTFFLQIEEWIRLLSTMGFRVKNAEFMEADGMEYIEAIAESKTIADIELQVKSKLKENLPEYMIPEEYYYYVDLPLTDNEKVDRDKILTDIKYLAEETEDYSDFSEDEYKLAEVWMKILGRKSISKAESFFEAGGDSLLSTKLLVELKNVYNIEISLTDILNNPYFGQMAEMLKNKLNIEEEYVEGEI